MISIKKVRKLIHVQFHCINGAVGEKKGESRKWQDFLETCLILIGMVI